MARAVAPKYISPAAKKIIVEDVQDEDLTTVLGVTKLEDLFISARRVSPLNMPGCKIAIAA
jgi:hypothetical protein